MSKKRHSGYLMAAWALSMIGGYAQAGVSLDRTRVIITEKEASSSANLSNTSPDIPFLAQSWVEDEKGNKITSPLLCYRRYSESTGGKKGIARVTKTAGIEKLPQDRESLFYLNVREIPPKPDKPNTLQLAMQSRIKLFYRPAAVIPKTRSEIWQDQVVFQKNGNQMTVQNPTPYYVTILGLSKGAGQKITQFPGINDRAQIEPAVCGNGRKCQPVFHDVRERLWRTPGAEVSLRRQYLQSASTGAQG